MLNDAEHLKRLRKQTKDFWSRHSGKSPLSYAEEYISSLLEHELECIRERGDGPSGVCKTLVLLVGYSIEPLLQSVCAYKPTDRIVLILSDRYPGIGTGDGKDYGTSLQEYIRKAIKQCQLDVQPQMDEPITVSANPAAVFNALRHTLRDATDVVIDITGAKKSMMSGAFLFAVFSGAKVSYVDWRDQIGNETGYSLDAHRPYGYAAVIGPLEPNPYQAFFLREWERVRALYERYDFRGAISALEQITAGMSDFPQFFRDAEKSLDASGEHNATQLLKKILECYEAWDAGHYARAADWAQRLKDDHQISVTLPRVVERLRGDWPADEEEADCLKEAQRLVHHADNHFERLERTQPLLSDPDRLGWYVRDELDRIARLINYHRDYRSALMRSVALDELLLKACVLTLWWSGRLEQMADGETAWSALNGSAPSSRKRSEIVQRVTKKLERTDLVRFMAQGESFRLAEIQYRLSPSVPLLKHWMDEHLAELRHKTTHTYMFVPPHVAQYALDSVCAMFEEYVTEFAQVSAPASEPQTPWSALCRMCGLDQYLPPSLLK